jgi:hypothetical protein
VGLHGEAHEELVCFDVVCEIAATGQAESVVAGVTQLATVDPLPVSDDKRAGAIVAESSEEICLGMSDEARS